MTTDTAHLEAAAAKQTQREDASGDLYTRLSRIEQRFQSPRDRAAAFLEIVCTALGGLSGSLTIAAGGEEHDLRFSTETPGLGAWSRTLADATHGRDGGPGPDADGSLRTPGGRPAEYQPDPRT